MTTKPFGDRLRRFSEFGRGRRREIRRLEQQRLWDEYIASRIPGSKGPFDTLELVPWTLYSTQLFESNDTTEISFFRGVGSLGELLTNMHLGGRLLPPQAFLLRRIRGWGLTSNLGGGVARLIIGDKIYGDSPAWLISGRQGRELDPPLFVSPHAHFSFDLRWQEPTELGRGLSGRPISSRPVQIVFDGDLLRPVQ